MVQSYTDIEGYYEDEIDCTSTGQVEIMPLDQRFVAIDLMIELNWVSGLVTPPTISVGTNSSSYDNVLGITALTLNNVNDVVLFRVPISLSGPSSLKVKIHTASLATHYQIKALITGYFE